MLEGLYKMKKEKICDSYEYDGYYNYSPGESAHCFGCIYLSDNFESNPPYYCSLGLNCFSDESCPVFDDYSDDGLPF